jgi:hypothetical protein
MKRKFLFKITATAIIIVMSSFAFMSYTTKKITNDLWKQLGMAEPDGKKSISTGFLQGYFNSYGAKNAKNVALGNRTAVVTDLLNYTKQYVTSQAFIKEYEKFRENMKPQPPEPMKTKESIREKYIKDAETGITNIEKILPSITDAKNKKALTDQIAIQKKQIEDYKFPNSKTIEISWQGEQNNFKWRNDEYLKSVKQWEADYPENHLQMVKARLLKFLEITKDIDYNAALTERNGKKILTNPKYEAKNAQWKMAFRAGKEVTETARTYAQQWLKELN